MKSVELLQGSPEWHAFRRLGIGGSDAPVVDGSSPYRTLRQLFNEKAGLGASEDSEDKEFIFAKGHKVEALIRAQFQELTGVEMAPLCAVHDKFDHVRASLDGFDPNKFGVLEAKLIGQEVLENARSKKRMKIEERIPGHHYTQIQHQLAVTGADVAHWFGHDGKTAGVMLAIKSNKKYQKSLLDQEHRFWDMVMRGEAPPLSDKDYLTPDDLSILNQLYDAKVLMDNAGAEFERLKKLAIETYNHPKIAGSGLKVFKVNRVGSVDPMSIPEVKTASEQAIKAVEETKKAQDAATLALAETMKAAMAKLKPDYIERFRSAGSSSWSVTVDKVKPMAAKKGA